MRRRLVVAIIIVSILAAASAFTFTIVSASSANENLFKSWRSLIAPILDLQNRVTQLEQTNQELEERINELEQEINDQHPTPHGIAVEIDAIKYSQGDDVTITGLINDPVNGEDQVTIKVKDPSGATQVVKDITLASNNEFDMVYSIDNSADDGIYTVQVQYSTDTTYSFFIVDGETDTVTVDTDHDTYNGGDDVGLSGEVDHTVTGEDAVQITITDPNNAKILSSQDVTLGEGTGVEDDEYKYTFTNLSNNADPGRYAVKVVYADNQEGFAIFTVEAASSANQITAILDKSTYKPGDSVTLTGTIDNVDSGLDLKIVFKDPTSHTIESDSNVAIASNGDFDFNFDLDNAADVGTYTITITYGSDALQLTFSVSESGS